MVADKAPMGGELNNVELDELRSALRWWLESGVDTAVAEEPRNWLAAPKAAVSSTPAPGEPPKPTQQAVVHETLDGLHQWLRDSSDLPFASRSARRVLPAGSAGAPIMLLADMPPFDSAGGDGPISGDAWQLTIRMLSAIGLKPEDAYRASLSCFNALEGLRGADLQACAEIARRQVALVKPQRLLLLGEAPCRALLGKPLAAARGHVQKIEGVRALATFHPSFLLNNPLQKEAAWADLLLLTED